MAKKSATKKKKSSFFYEKKSAWLKWNSKETSQAMKFAEGYMDFLNSVKTEYEFVDYSIPLLESKGYSSYEKLSKKKKLSWPLKVYFNNRDVCLAAFSINRDFMKKGISMIFSHIDTPRIDVRQNPLREEHGFSLFKTTYYGGIRRYHWANIPLALHGRVITKAGKTLNIVIGEDEQDPVFMICDLLPHLRSSQNERKTRDVFKGEELDVITGNIPLDSKDKDVSEKIKANVLKLLNEKYGIVEQDLFTADLTFVPAFGVRDMGLDRSMIAGYGHDDRICAYTSLAAQVDSAKSKSSFGCYFLDKEEIGSTGATGAQSRFIENCLIKLLNLSGSKSPLLDKVELMEKSPCISADVGVAITPTFTEPFDLKGDPQLGFGTIVSKFVGGGGKGGSHEAKAAFTGQVTRLFDSKKIPWQLGGFGKVDTAGGGTVAKFIAQYSMDVIDIGPGVVSMHSPCEVISKADLYSTYQAYHAFLNQ